MYNVIFIFSLCDIQENRCERGKNRTQLVQSERASLDHCYKSLNDHETYYLLP
jgi:hypothetical protein